MILNALAVDNARASLVVLRVGDDHLPEGREGGKDGATDPHAVLTLWLGDNLDLHRRRGKAGDLLLDTLRKYSVLLTPKKEPSRGQLNAKIGILLSQSESSKRHP